ncbi:hypothetical protein ACWC0C_07075 [Streptomyces sp. NPDC001709]
MPETQEPPTVPISKINTEWTKSVVLPARAGVTQIVTDRGRPTCKLMPPAEFEAVRKQHPIATDTYSADAARRSRSEIVRRCEDPKGPTAALVADPRYDRAIVALVPLNYPAAA